MFLMIAFACFFVMFAVWLIVPNVDDKAIRKVPAETAPASPGTAPARA